MEQIEYGSEMDTLEATELFTELSEAGQYAILDLLAEVLSSRDRD